METRDLTLLLTGIAAGAVLSPVFLRGRKKRDKERKIQKKIIEDTEPQPGFHKLKRSSSRGSIDCLAPVLHKTRLHIGDVYVHQIPHLDEFWDTESVENCLQRTPVGPATNCYSNIVGDDEVILSNIIYKSESGSFDGRCEAYVRAGPRREIMFAPGTVTAAIVTCGGLCPGLNNVIRELTMTLYYSYGVDKILGIRGGYRGFYDADYLPPMDLHPKSVAKIHEMGGTILGSSRGGSDMDAIVDAIQDMGINQVFVIGGDGTHRGAAKMYEKLRERKAPVAVVGVPKTIDNDIEAVDRCFGFQTAVDESLQAIASAKTEAECAPNGIGIVKLMGRHAGFIAAHATLSSRLVNYCLLPEVDLVLEGENGLLPHLKSHVMKHGNAVIVTAEGAGENLMESTGETDASGNKKLGDVGGLLKKAIGNYFKSEGVEVNIKYIDPSYIIRSVKANAFDSTLCMLLAQNAVHGAMAGYSGFTVGVVNNRTVYLPIGVVTSHPKRINPGGRTYQRVLQSTWQPDMRLAKEE